MTLIYGCFLFTNQFIKENLISFILIITDKK